MESPPPHYSEPQPTAQPTSIALPTSRARLACDVCRKRKNKCSEGRPCTRCIAYSIHCTYSKRNSRNRHAKRGIGGDRLEDPLDSRALDVVVATSQQNQDPNPDNVAVLQNRIIAAEKLVRSLNDELVKERAHERRVRRENEQARATRSQSGDSPVHQPTAPRIGNTSIVPYNNESDLLSTNRGYASTVLNTTELFLSAQGSGIAAPATLDDLTIVPDSAQQANVPLNSSQGLVYAQAPVLPYPSVAHLHSSPGSQRSAGWGPVNFSDASPTQGSEDWRGYARVERPLLRAGDVLAGHPTFSGSYAVMEPSVAETYVESGPDSGPWAQSSTYLEDGPAPAGPPYATAQGFSGAWYLSGVHN